MDSPEFTVAETDPGGPPADTEMTVVKNNPSPARASAKKSALNFRTENSLSANVEIKPLSRYEDTGFFRGFAVSLTV